MGNNQWLIVDDGGYFMRIMVASVVANVVANDVVFCDDLWRRPKHTFVVRDGM